MTFLVYLLLVIGIMLLVNGLMQPKTFRVYRTISINSPGKDVYPLIADLKHWDNWSPWAQKDPNMRKDYSSPSTESDPLRRELERHGWDTVDRQVLKPLLTLRAQRR